MVELLNTTTTDISSGAWFEALTKGVLIAPLDSRYTQVGFNLISVKVCQYIAHWACIGVSGGLSESWLQEFDYNH